MDIPVFHIRADNQTVFLILLVLTLILTTIHITLIMTNPIDREEISPDTIQRSGMMYGRSTLNQEGTTGEIHIGRGAGVHPVETTG